MNLINGIGGVFITSIRPKELADWYAEHFGMVFEGSEEFGAYYQVWIMLDPDRPDRKLDQTFAIMRAREDFSRPAPESEPTSFYGDQPFMLNLRTDDIDALLAHLDSRGVPTIDRRDEGYGIFAWIRDPEGNRIELYQPVEKEGE